MERPPTTGLPWARFLVEGIVIVVSILLAFFVDTSWERAQQRRAERDYLVSLQREVAVTRSEIDARYQSTLETQSRRDDQAWAIWEGRIQPLLEGRIPRTDRLIRGTFGPSRGGLPFGLSRHQADWAGVLTDPVFEDILAERWMRLQLADSQLRDVRVHVEEVAALIEARLRLLRSRTSTPPRSVTP